MTLKSYIVRELKKRVKKDIKEEDVMDNDIQHAIERLLFLIDLKETELTYKF